MHVSATLLLHLGLILLALTVVGALARKVGLSPIPLYLLAGLALGEGGLVTPDPAVRDFIETGATIGIVLLLLVLGLEFSVREFSSSMGRHLPSAGWDIVLNATPGALAGLLLGMDPVAVVALAGATYISSSGIVARLLSDLGRLANRETPAVLSVLVLEDFVMAAYLPLLAVLASGGDLGDALLGATIALAALATAFGVTYRWGRHVSRLIHHDDPEQLLLRVLGLTLVVAALAEMVHISAAVGAFLVGLSISGWTAQLTREVLTPLRDLFAAVLFVSIGLVIDPRDLGPVLVPALLLAVVTGGTKVVTGMLAAARDGAARRGRLRAGAALVTRGEFSLVIVGLAAAADDRLAPLVAAYVVILAIAGPILTRYLGAGPVNRGTHAHAR